jgi:hypothetical protein
MFKVTCLAAPERKTGTPQRLALGSPRRTAQHNITSREANTQSINIQQTCIMNALNERVNDSTKFGARIAEIGVAVAKIWQNEVIGTYLEFLESA